MGEWKEYKIDEVAKISTGFAFSGDEYEFKGILRVVRGENVTIGNLRWDSEKYWNKATNGLDQYYLQENDIVIGMDGSRVGHNRAKIKSQELPLILAQRVARLRAKEGFDQEFLWYHIFSDNFKDYVEAVHTGTSIPHISQKQIADFEIFAPILESEQTAIASILSSLDDKIDLLHRQNATLEKMAETLFRQWFVEEAKEDWVRTKIGDVLDTVLGGTPSTKKPEYWDGNIPWINSGEVNNFRILQCSRFITELGLKKSNTKLLPVGTTVLAITGATLGQVSLLEIDTCANQSVVGIIPNGTLPKEFIFLWIKMKISEIILSETGGAQPHINKNDINETDIVIPDSDYLNKIKLTIEPLFKKITHNSFQIRTLTALRDTLLPKLMSGEVRVD
jgi:type I restriction enzyme S subunit